MDKSQFQQFADDIKEEAQQGDYKRDDVVTVPVLRIHQDKTQNPPEGSEVGMLYSPTAGFVSPTRAVRCTILDMVNLRQIWTPWTAKDKHIICKCFDQTCGFGNPFYEDEERWVPGDEERECSRCANNVFRNRAYEPLDPLLYNGKPLSLSEKCKSGKLFAAFKLPEDPEEEISLESVMPFYFQVGASIFSNAYTRLPNSWEAFVVGCNQTKPPIPWMACKLELTTQEIETPNGPTRVPVFQLIGVHVGLLEKVRVIEGAYKDRLALKAPEVQPEIPPDE